MDDRKNSPKKIKDRIEEEKRKIKKMLSELKSGDSRLSIPPQAILEMKLSALIRLLVSKGIIRGDEYALKHIEVQRERIKMAIESMKEQTKSRLVVAKTPIVTPKDIGKGGR